MKKILCLLFVLLLFLGGCSPNDAASKADAFTQNKNGNLVNGAGVEYAHLANEGDLYYLGTLELAGSVRGEEGSLQHFGVTLETGMFAIENDVDQNILIRYTPNNEWFAIYRKTSRPSVDFTVDNCDRLEFVPGIGNAEEDLAHATCGEGITDPAEIAAFLSEVREQESPRDAGLYDLVMKPDGMFENCYVCGNIYGFFEEEPNLVICMMVQTYNDLAYSVRIGENEYVLPTQWAQKLLNN